MHIIDRRLNPGGKSLANRQRFIRRARALVRKAVRDASASRSIKDAGKGGEISIPADGAREPVFRRSAEGGKRDYLLPGNKKYVEGDTIPRPEGGGKGSGPGQDGEGEDDFRFALTDDEFLELYLEDLELPDLAKRQVKGVAAIEFRKAGYSVSGPPARMSVPRTMRNALSRRLALRRPTARDIEALEQEIADAEGDPEALEAARARLERAQRRMKLIPYIDPLDVRYRRLEATPKPIAQAAMFCLMDVSGSMTEHMKDLAKRFYSLLYLFLTRRYKHVDVIFIRHTHQAEEVDEQTFFYSRETGGTIVSTALEEMIKVIKLRYPVDAWNIYGAQASDGDNTTSDNPKAIALLENDILPICQYYAYVEVGAEDEDDHRSSSQQTTNLWRAYNRVLGPDVPMSMKKVRHRRDIYPVFRELFAKRQEGAEAP